MCPQHYSDANEHCALPAPSNPPPKGQLLPNVRKQRGSQVPAVKRLQRAAVKAHDSEQLAESLVHFPALIAVGYSKARGAPAASFQEKLHTPSSGISAQLEWVRQSSCEQPGDQPGVQGPARSQADSRVHPQDPAAGSSTSSHPHGWPQESQVISVFFFL